MAHVQKLGLSFKIQAKIEFLLSLSGTAIDMEICVEICDMN